MAMLGGHESEDLGTTKIEEACFMVTTGEEAHVRRFTEPRAAGKELRELGRARMVEERDQFLGFGIEEGPQGQSGQDFAVLFEEVLKVLYHIAFFESGGSEAELHHAFDFSEDVVLAKHGGRRRRRGANEDRGRGGFR